MQRTVRTLAVSAALAASLLRTGCFAALQQQKAIEAALTKSLPESKFARQYSKSIIKPYFILSPLRTEN